LWNVTKSDWGDIHIEIDFAERIFDKHQFEIDPPKIWIGPDKSIDLYWRWKGLKFIVNIPDNKEEEVAFYTKSGDIKLEGSVKHED
jgi:hypothetical protein